MFLYLKYGISYAQFVAKDVFPLKQIYPLDVIPMFAVQYAVRMANGRCEELEPAILTCAGPAYQYADIVIGGRWPEAENMIIQDVFYTRLYVELIQEKWPEAERRHGIIFDDTRNT